MPPKTLPTSKMAQYVGLSADFLRKNKEVLFFAGKHYVRPFGLNKDMWIVEEMEKWMMGEVPVSQKAQKVLEGILS